MKKQFYCRYYIDNGWADMTFFAHNLNDAMSILHGRNITYKDLKSEKEEK